MSLVWQLLTQLNVLKYRLPYILAYKPTIFGWILRIKLWGSAYTQVMPHSHTLTARVSVAWTIVGHEAFVQAWEHARRAVGPYTDCCCCCIPAKSSTVTWHHSNTHTRQGHRLAKPHTSCQVSRCHVHACCTRCTVNSLTLTHYQCTDLGYMFDANFRYQLMRQSLIFATLSASGMGVGLYTGWLIHEEDIRYKMSLLLLLV